MALKVPAGARKEHSGVAASRYTRAKSFSRLTAICTLQSDCQLLLQQGRYAIYIKIVEVGCRGPMQWELHLPSRQLATCLACGLRCKS